MTFSDLEDALQLGLSVVRKNWSYKTKDWVTSVYAADIDNDGDTEIVAGSRDGRVHVITNEGERQWDRIVGDKKGISSVIGVVPEEVHSPGVLVGTQDGKVYALTGTGQIIGKDCQTVYSLEPDGPSEQEIQAFWHNSEYDIRYLSGDFKKSPLVVIDSEDRTISTLDYRTGKHAWKFRLNGAVSALFSYDVTTDGEVETLVGSSDQHLYILDNAGNQIGKHDVQGQIHTMYAADVDKKDDAELLLGMDGKTLALYTHEMEQVWRQPFQNNFFALAVADVDGDGENEVLVGSDDKHLYILDGKTGEEIWRHYLGTRISSIYTCDVDNDKRDEVLIGSQDNRVYCLNIQLFKGLKEKIRTLYKKLGRPPIQVLEETLNREQITLLQHLIKETKPLVKPITVEKIDTLLEAEKLEAEKYILALQDALHLKQHRVEAVWSKDLHGTASAVTFGDISKDKKLEIIVGTTKGIVYAFNTKGREIWSLPLKGGIQAVQTAYLDRKSRWANILVASTDQQLYVLSGVKQDAHRRKRVEGGEVLRERDLEEQITDIHVYAPNGKGGPIEILVSTEDKKILMYDRGFEKQPIRTFKAPKGIRVVYAHEVDDTIPAVVAGSVGDTDCEVYAFTRDGKVRWESCFKGRIEALHMKDVDGDEHIETIVASDRNVHVLDQEGTLKWRYYLSHDVVTLDVLDIDGDSRVEILAGCSDGQLYVLNSDGDLLWTYQANSGILAVRAADIDNDEAVEIVIASENKIEVVRVVKQRRLQNLITRCWTALQQEKSVEVLIHEFSTHPSPHLRAFALHELADQKHQTMVDFHQLEGFTGDGSLEVRKALIHTVTANYTLNYQQARNILSKLMVDAEPEIRFSLIKHISSFVLGTTPGSWEEGFPYLQRLARNNDLFVRRAVMRELYMLVEDFWDKPKRKRRIFELLLNGLLEPEIPLIKASDWVRQEAAHTLARFLDLHRNELIMYINLLLVKEVKSDILQRVSYHATTSFIKNIFQNMGTLVFDLEEENVHERLMLTVRALAQTEGLRYGLETLATYKELYYLSELSTIEDVANYQCSLKKNTTMHPHFVCVLEVFGEMDAVASLLRHYLRRDGLKDRVNSLLEANTRIERARTVAEQEYGKTSLGEPMTKLPDKAVIDLLLNRWQTLVTAELHLLSGEAELTGEIQTREGRFEEQVVVWLQLRNKGRITASDVYVTLLDSEQFDVIGRHTFETEAIFAQDEVVAEFTIQPRALSPNLVFEILYSDTEDKEKRVYVDGLLTLSSSQEQQAFRPIDNVYSTGVPSLNMCYGREDNLSFLCRNLMRSAATLLILYGQRRTGKTTLLFQLANTEALYPHIPVLIDMQNESLGISESRLFYKFAEYITQALKKHTIDVPLPGIQAFEKESVFTFNAFLDEVETLLTEQKLIILIDEFEVLETQVTKGKLALEIFEYLRSMVQYRAKVTFLLSGVHTIQELTESYWSTFFNMADHYRLSKLTEQGATHLITHPVEGFLTYDPYAIKKIRQLTDDQPYLIHLVCRQLIDYCNEQEKVYVTLHDLNTILDDIVEKGKNHFKWVWDQSSPQEHQLLSIMAEFGAEEGRLLSLAEIEEHFERYAITYKREDILISLNGLIERDVVVSVSDSTREGTSDAERYRISVGLIRNWLRKTKAVKQVLLEERIKP